MDANACGYPIGERSCDLPKGHVGAHSWNVSRDWESEWRELHIELAHARLQVSLLHGTVRGLKAALRLALKERK